MDRIPYISQPVHFRRRDSIGCRASIVVRVFGDVAVVDLCLLPDERHADVEFRSTVSFEYCVMVPRGPAGTGGDSWHFPCDKVE